MTTAAAVLKAILANELLDYDTSWWNAKLHAPLLDGLLEHGPTPLRRYVTTLHELRDHRRIVEAVARWREASPYPHDTIDTWSLLAMGTAAAVAVDDAENALAWSRELDGIKHRAKQTSPAPYNKYVYELRAKGEVRAAIAAMAAAPRKSASPVKITTEDALETHAGKTLGSSIVTVLAFDAKRRIGWVIDHERSGDRVLRWDGEAFVRSDASYIDFGRFVGPNAPTWSTKPADQRIVFGSRARDIATVELHGTDIYSFSRSAGGGHSQRRNFWMVIKNEPHAMELFELLVAQHKKASRIDPLVDPKRGLVVRTYVEGWGSGKAKTSSIAIQGTEVYVAPPPNGTKSVDLVDETGARERFGVTTYKTPKAALGTLAAFEQSRLEARGLLWLSFMKPAPAKKMR